MRPARRGFRSPFNSSSRRILSRTNNVNRQEAGFSSMAQSCFIWLGATGPPRSRSSCALDFGPRYLNIQSALVFLLIPMFSLLLAA